MPRATVLFVFGMGRSGTSALARVLSLCGAALPEVLLEGGKGNPLGHWEPREAMDFDEAFLKRYGSNWWDPTFRLQHEVTVDAADAAALTGDIHRFLDQETANNPLLVVKEPRIAALSEYWFEAVRRADLAPKIVIPVRHPAEVAGSLARRDGVTPELGGYLWLKYNLLAELRSRHLPRIFVAFPNLMNDWRKEVGRIRDRLAVPLAPQSGEAVDTFLSPDLYHERETGFSFGGYGSAWLRQVYEIFSAAAADAPVDAMVLDRVYAEYRACERSFRIALHDHRIRG